MDTTSQLSERIEITKRIIRESDFNRWDSTINQLVIMQSQLEIVKMLRGEKSLSEQFKEVKDYITKL